MLDQLDNFIDVGQRNGQAFEQMRAVSSLAQVEDRAPGNHFAPVQDESIENLLEVEQTRLAVDQRHHVDAEHVLHLGLLVQVVQNHVGNFTAAQFDHHAHAVLVGFVTQTGNALEAFLLDQLGNFLQQARLVYLVGQLGDDNALLARLVFFVMGPRAQVNLALAAAVGFTNSARAVDIAGGREIGPRNTLHQLFDLDVRLIDHQDAGIDDFAQIMRRDIGRHADGDAGGTVDQQVRHPCRQDDGFVFRLVVVRQVVDGFLFQVRQQLVRYLRHAYFGITHGRRRIAIDGTEVTLAVDQHVTHGEGLRHAHDGVINRGIAVRVIFTDDVTDHARRFLVGFIEIIAEHAHGVEDASMHGLETIAHIG